MSTLITIIVTFFAGMGAGLGTGFARLSAAAVISTMLITILGKKNTKNKCTCQHSISLYIWIEQEP